MRILIAGAGGQIGSRLIKELKIKHSIYSLSKNLFSKNTKKNINLDLTNSIEVEKFTEQCKFFSVVVFLVGLNHGKGKKEDQKKFMEVNYKTLYNLVLSLKKYNKEPEKIIFASSISVYGENLSKSYYFEEDTKNPISPYATSKHKAENFLIESYYEKSWILRFAPVYSSEFTLNIDRRTKISNLFFKVGNGNSYFSLCNLKNIISVVRAIIKEQIPSGTYNISDAKHYSFNDLLKYRQAKNIMCIPSSFIKVLYYYGLLVNNIFLKENTIKLISNNIYPSDKIRKYKNLTHLLK